MRDTIQTEGSLTKITSSISFSDDRIKIMKKGSAAENEETSGLRHKYNLFSVLYTTQLTTQNHLSIKFYNIYNI